MTGRLWTTTGRTIDPDTSRLEMSTIRRAGLKDLPEILSLLEEAIGWLGRAGLDQWQYGPNPVIRMGSALRRSLSGGTVWVVHDSDSVLTATITLDERADPEFWLPSDEPDDAFYAHRMVVRRERKGLYLGSAMLDWASRKAAAAGKTWLRLDAWSSNSTLHAYYLREGFETVRILRYEHRGSGALFQRRAGVELHRSPGLVELP